MTIGKRLLAGAALFLLCAGTGMLNASLTTPGVTYSDALGRAGMFLVVGVMLLGFNRFVVQPAMVPQRSKPLPVRFLFGWHVLIVAASIGWLLLRPEDPAPQRVGLLLTGCGGLLAAMLVFGPARREHRRRSLEIR